MAFRSEEWPKGKFQAVWIWNPGKFPSFCTGVLKVYKFGQIPSAILVDWAIFRTFLDFAKMWTRWNFESIFLKIVHQKGLFDAIKENPNFPSCCGILDIYRQWLLSSLLWIVQGTHLFQKSRITLSSRAQASLPAHLRTFKTISANWMSIKCVFLRLIRTHKTSRTTRTSISRYLRLWNERTTKKTENFNFQLV